MPDIFFKKNECNAFRAQNKKAVFPFHCQAIFMNLQNQIANMFAPAMQLP